MVNFLRKVKRSFLVNRAKKRVKKAAQQPVVKIVVGASNVFEKGWIATEIDFLNMLNEKDWQYFFNENGVDAILAEHVWEHLYPAEALQAAKFCYKYLKPGGYLRVAVPDGNHPDKSYIDYVKPGGAGDGADDHKMLYTESTFRKLFEEAGFTVHMLEWFDENGEFHAEHWDKDDGMIWRSKQFDQRNADGKLNYTSLIIDAVK
jgi:predicted SAM-dependent methyltransferase